MPFVFIDYLIFTAYHGIVLAGGAMKSYVVNICAVLVIFACLLFTINLAGEFNKLINSNVDNQKNDVVQNSGKSFKSPYFSSLLPIK